MENRSPKNKISPGQAILIWLDHHQHDKAPLVNQVFKIYLEGISNEQDKKVFESIVKDKVLEKFDVSNDANIINNDVTKLFFESELAYQTLTSSIPEIDTLTLQKHYDMLYEQFSKLQKDKNITLTDIVVLKTEATAVLQGQFKGLGLKENCIYQEYNDLILYIENLDRDQFSEIFKKNAKLIAKSCFLSIAIAQKKKDLPFESTYVKEFTDEKRGKRLINTGDPVYTEKYQLKKNEVFRLHVGIASYDKKLSNCHKQVKQIENDIANFNDKPSEDETSDEEQNPLSLENLNQDLQTEIKLIDRLTEEKNILNEMLVKLNLELLDLEIDIQAKLATNPFSVVKGIFKKDMHSNVVVQI